MAQLRPSLQSDSVGPNPPPLDNVSDNNLIKGLKGIHQLVRIFDDLIQQVFSTCCGAENRHAYNEVARKAEYNPPLFVSNGSSTFENINLSSSRSSHNSNINNDVNAQTAA
ncbi:hypothetical protein VNO77_30737 [Canavalia gladiata]|uniref:Uncharacterized protein n=1 Tax=Canavalia gladiata TaxID=3824 RepID=A0AAN9KNB0_CANGL